MHASKKVKPIPDGMRSVTPHQRDVSPDEWRQAMKNAPPPEPRL